jgi:hypothetical protein
MVARNYGPWSILTENRFSAIGFLSRSRFGPNTSVPVAPSPRALTGAILRRSR